MIRNDGPQIEPSTKEDMAAAASMSSSQEHHGATRSINERPGAMSCQTRAAHQRGAGGGWSHKEQSGTSRSDQEHKGSIRSHGAQIEPSTKEEMQAAATISASQENTVRSRA